MTMRRRGSLSTLSLGAFILLLAATYPPPVSAQPMTITAYKSQHPVILDGITEPGEWNDTQTITDPTSGMTFAIKQNGTGLLFLMAWNESSPYCSDEYCFGGIELGYQNNTSPMGSPTTPTTMILVGTSFKGNVDDFVSTGETTPASVESAGYVTQTTCGFTLVDNQYTAECYRPFNTADASPQEVKLGVGSTVEIAFAVGEFSEPGTHLATNMDTYVLTISNQTYGETTVSSATTASTSLGTPVGPSVLDYSLELMTIVTGFTLVVLLVLVRYQRSR